MGREERLQELLQKIDDVNMEIRDWEEQIEILQTERDELTDKVQTISEASAFWVREKIQALGRE